VAGLHVNAHPLHSEEESKFEELRPLLKQWATASTNPVLPEIAKELKFLESLREEGEGLEEVEKKIDLISKKYGEEKAHLEHLIREIIKLNEEVKDIRRRSGMETVPWKVQVKEYSFEGRPSYDIGVSAFEVSEKVVANSPADVAREEQRREEIRSEQYFLRVFANNYEVGRSEKVKLQWPSYKVNFQQKFSILVYTAPATLKVEIVKSGFINTVIDTIYLAVPGLNAKSITSSEKRYSSTPFYSNGQEIRKQIK
jgi:regulator of replication initiation timing